MNNYIPISDFFAEELASMSQAYALSNDTGEDCGVGQTSRQSSCQLVCQCNVCNNCSGSCATACTSGCDGICQVNCQNGGQTISTYKNTDSFSWSITPKAGNTIKITATDWNKLRSCITQAISQRAQLSPLQGKDVDSGDVIYADTFNTIAKSVGNAEVKKDKTIIEAQLFLDLMNSYNSTQITPFEPCCEIGESCKQKPK